MLNAAAPPHLVRMPQPALAGHATVRVALRSRPIANQLPAGGIARPASPLRQPVRSRTGGPRLPSCGAAEQTAAPADTAAQCRNHQAGTPRPVASRGPGQRSAGAGRAPARPLLLPGRQVPALRQPRTTPRRLTLRPSGLAIAAPSPPMSPPILAGVRRRAAVPVARAELAACPRQPARRLDGAPEIAK